MIEHTGIIRSANLDNSRTVWIREPRQPVVRDIVVFLDAELYRERVGASELVDEFPDAWFIYVSMHSVEARWVECPCFRPFARFVGEELFPWLSGWFPAVAQAERRTLIGLSYSGLAAAYIAQEAPGLFYRVISQSGSFWWRDCWLVNAYAEGIVPVGTAFYLEVGSSEVEQNIQHREDVFQVISQVEGVRRFRDVLLRRGVPVRYAEFVGGHSFPCWRATLPQALCWALAHPPAGGLAKGD